MKLGLAGLLLVATVGIAAADATAPRAVDLAATMVVSGPAVDAGSTQIGEALDLRYYPGPVWWFGPEASFQVAENGQDPEAALLTTQLAAGLAGGAHATFAHRVEGFAGLRADGVRASGMPMSRGSALGIAVGPMATLALVVGEAWGHPMSLEARASWLTYAFEGGTARATWETGLALRGVLFPDRPLK